MSAYPIRRGYATVFEVTLGKTPTIARDMFTEGDN